jgi:hypothetical protein
VLRAIPSKSMHVCIASRCSSGDNAKIIDGEAGADRTVERAEVDNDILPETGRRASDCDKEPNAPDQPVDHCFRFHV